VKATYRRGSRSGGLVKQASSPPCSPVPPGLKSALNPVAAEGADEPESFANAQQNAPITGAHLIAWSHSKTARISAAAMPGSRKPWRHGHGWPDARRFLTIAGPLGATVSTSLAADLITAIHAAGDPFVPVQAVSYQKALFKLAGKIKIDPDYEAEKGPAAANDKLRDTFSFTNRQFGQPVNLSEVIALVQACGRRRGRHRQLYLDGQDGKMNSCLEAELPNGGDPRR